MRAGKQVFQAIPVTVQSASTIQLPAMPATSPANGSTAAPTAGNATGTISMLGKAWSYCAQVPNPTENLKEVTSNFPEQPPVVGLGPSIATIRFEVIAWLARLGLPGRAGVRTITCDKFRQHNSKQKLVCLFLLFWLFLAPVGLT